MKPNHQEFVVYSETFRRASIQFRIFSSHTEFVSRESSLSSIAYVCVQLILFTYTDPTEMSGCMRNENICISKTPFTYAELPFQSKLGERCEQDVISMYTHYYSQHMFSSVMYYQNRIKIKMLLCFHHQRKLSRFNYLYLYLDGRG